MLSTSPIPQRAVLRLDMAGGSVHWAPGEGSQSPATSHVYKMIERGQKSLDWCGRTRSLQSGLVAWGELQLTVCARAGFCQRPHHSSCRDCWLLSYLWVSCKSCRPVRLIDWLISAGCLLFARHYLIYSHNHLMKHSPHFTDDETESRDSWP